MSSPQITTIFGGLPPPAAPASPSFAFKAAASSGVGYHASAGGFSADGRFTLAPAAVAPSLLGGVGGASGGVCGAHANRPHAAQSEPICQTRVNRPRVPILT